MQTAYPSCAAETAATQSIKWSAAIRRLAAGLVFAFGLSLCSGCVGAPPRKITALEQARAENETGKELAQPFEAKLRYSSDPAVDHYLNTVARTLSSANGDPRLTDAHVAVIQDRGGQWRSYGLPGRKIYFSTGLLHQLQFDNEVAAVIALEFGNILQRHALNHFKKLESVKPVLMDYFGIDGLFSFDLEEIKLSIKSALEVLYSAGFDNRALIRLWSIFEENPEHSPFPEKVLEELSDYTRDTITRYAPLRNPIIMTEEFKSIRKRIQKL